MPEELKGRFSVIIPVLNERENLEALLPKLSGYNLIIVDDGSTDGTAELCMEKENVLFIERNRKLGLVSAVIEGFRNAPAESKFLVTMDSDTSHDPSIVESMVSVAEKDNVDMLIGSRYIKGGKHGDKFFRKIMSRSANLLFRIAFSSRVRDGTSGFRVYSRKLADFILEEDRIQGISPSYAGQVDILRRALNRNFKVAEFPINFGKRKNGNSKLKITDITQFASLLARKGYLMRYVLVGASGVIINEMLLKLFLGLIGSISELIAVEGSILSNFVLNDRITFRTQEIGKGRYLKRMVKYNFFNLGGVGINIAVFLTLFSYGFNPLIANLFGIIFAFAFTYFTSIFIVWRRL